MLCSLLTRSLCGYLSTYWIAIDRNWHHCIPACRIQLKLMAMKSGALRALWASTRGSLVPKLLPRAPSHRFCSAVATKLEPASTAKPASVSESESASASASEHAVANAANANLKSRTWDEHRLTADQLQYRDLASVCASLSISPSFAGWLIKCNCPLKRPVVLVTQPGSKNSRLVRSYEYVALIDQVLKRLSCRHTYAFSLSLSLCDCHWTFSNPLIVIMQRSLKLM